LDFIFILDLLGTISFAISGVLTATKKRLDIFGILIIATVTAVGGGTVRDVLIGKTPVTWMMDVRFLYIIAGSTFFAMIFSKALRYMRTSLFLFDTIGIGLYTVAGVKIGLAAQLHPVTCVILGTLSACFGGVIRDILCNEIPVIFRKEVYATACIVGAVIYILLHKANVSSELASILAASAVITIRLLAVRFNLQLPSPYRYSALGQGGNTP